MVDFVSKERRSKIMSSIHSKNTSIDNKIAILLKKAKIKFKRYPKISGNPDFLVDKKIAVFVDGCFWHKCPKHYKEPKTRTNFWRLKIKRNSERDKEVNMLLKGGGYKIIRFWEHDIEKNAEKCMGRILIKK